VAEHAAVVRGIADRAADVAADLEARETCGQRSCGAARGSARRARAIPRIVGHAVDVVIGLKIQQTERHVGLAEEHRAGRLDALDDQIVALSDVAQCAIAPGGGQASHIERLLDRHRHAVQRTARQPAGERFICPS
jgi:hypothetical protein